MLSFNSSALSVPHRGQGSGRGLSPRVWAKMKDTITLSPDGMAYPYGVLEDFENWPYCTLTTAAGQLAPPNGWFLYNEVDATVGSIGNVADKVGGVLRLLASTDAADGDDHDLILTTGGNVGGFCKISDTAGEDKLLCFEARFQVPTVTDGEGTYFIGLTQEGRAAAQGTVANATHAPADIDLIGFFIKEDDNDALKFIYQKNGGALQTVLTYGTALTANTWYKVGFVYDPSAPASERIKVFVDNVEQSTYVTATNIAAATFPDGEELAVTVSVKNSANNAARSMLLDWVACLQVG